MLQVSEAVSQSHMVIVTLGPFLSIWAQAPFRHSLLDKDGYPLNGHCLALWKLCVWRYSRGWGWGRVEEVYSYRRTMNMTDFMIMPYEWAYHDHNVSPRQTMLTMIEKKMRPKINYKRWEYDTWEECFCLLKINFRHALICGGGWVHEVEREYLYIVSCGRMLWLSGNEV